METTSGILWSAESFDVALLLGNMESIQYLILSKTQQRMNISTLFSTATTFTEVGKFCSYI